MQSWPDRDSFARILNERLGDMSIAELARKTNLNRQQIHRYVKGDAIPRADAFMQICAALNIDPHLVFGRANDFSDQLASISLTDFRQTDLRRLSSFRRPSDQVLPVGVYQAYHPSLQIPQKYARLAVLVSDTGTVRTFYTRHPVSMFDGPSSPQTREIVGLAFSDHGENCQLVGLWRNEATLHSSIHQFFFGPPHPRTEIRIGIYAGPDNFPVSIHPFSAKVVLIRRPNAQFHKVFRESGLLPAHALPRSVVEVFKHQSSSPDLMWGRPLRS